MNGTEYKGRTVRCNDADEEGHGRRARGSRSESRESRRRGGREAARAEARGKAVVAESRSRKPRREEETGDWRQFFQHNDNVKFKGEEPNFEEEGWARRRPKKK